MKSKREARGGLTVGRWYYRGRSTGLARRRLKIRSCRANLAKVPGSLQNVGNEEVAMVSRQEVALALRRSLLKGRIEPMFGVEEIGDLNEDLNQFLLQERLLARLHRPWPSVLVSPADDDYAASSPERAVPIDLDVNTDLNASLSDAAQQVDREFWEAQNQGLPVWTTPLPNARRSFLKD